MWYLKPVVLCMIGTVLGKELFRVPRTQAGEDKAMVFRLIDTIITKKKFKDFVATMQ